MGKILIAGNDEGMRSFMACVLEWHGFTVIETDFSGAQVKISKNRPDVIVVDSFPAYGEIDVYGFLKLLKKSPETKDIPVVFCTTECIPEINRQVEALGGHCIYKPFGVAVFYEKIKEILKENPPSGCL